MTREEHDYRLACLILGALMLLLAAGLALGVIWVRQSNTSMAREIKSLESNVEVAQRKLRFISEKYAEAHMPANLMRMAENDFIVPAQRQVRWVSIADPVRETTSVASREPYQSTYNLAFLAMTQR